MAERRRYSAKTKAKAVGIATVEGVTEAERVTGIPKQTIDYWMDKPEFGHLRTTARETVIDQFWVGVQVGVEQVTAGLKGDAPLNHKADALRTLAERYALLTGGATARTELRDISDTLSDADIIRTIRAADDLTGTGDSGTPEEAPVPSEG